MSGYSVPIRAISGIRDTASFSRRSSGYFLAAYASLPAMQHEVIADMEHHAVTLVVMSGGTWSDRIDGISQRQRLPLIADYLDLHFGPPQAVGRFTFRHRIVAE